MEISVEQIRNKLATDNRWLARGILAIYARQTEEEKAIAATLSSNGIGFNGCDSFILSSFAEQLKAGRTLSTKQVVIARKKMLKYAGQLKKIADSA